MSHDRMIVFFAFVVVMAAMCGLVIFKGCSGADTIIVQLGSVATGLAGALAGLSRASVPDQTTKVTSEPPNKVTTETKTEQS